MTVSLRMSSDAACAPLPAPGPSAGTMPRVCPTCQGSGMQTQPGRRLRDDRAVSRLPRSRPDRRRSLPGMPRLWTRRLDPHDPGADPGGGARRSADPAARQGRSRASAAVPPATSTSRSTSSRTRCSVARATTSRSTVPVPLRRGRARRRDRGSDARRLTGHAEDPCRHSRTAARSGVTRRGVSRAATARWRPARDRRGRDADRAGRRCPCRRPGLLRRDLRRGPARGAEPKGL